MDQNDPAQNTPRAQRDWVVIGANVVAVLFVLGASLMAGANGVLGRTVVMLGLN